MRNYSDLIGVTLYELLHVIINYRYNISKNKIYYYSKNLLLQVTLRVTLKKLMQNVLQDAKPGRELDYLLVRANSWSGKPVYIELWVHI